MMELHIIDLFSLPVAFRLVVQSDVTRASAIDERPFSAYDFYWRNAPIASGDSLTTGLETADH
jgi:hypothetical protein